MQDGSLQFQIHTSITFTIHMYGMYNIHILYKYLHTHVVHMIIYIHTLNIAAVRGHLTSRAKVLETGSAEQVADRLANLTLQ